MNQNQRDHMINLRKKIDVQNHNLKLFTKIFNEMHPNEHFLYAIQPHGMVSHFGDAYRTGYIFVCLNGKELKQYFYYESELLHKVNVRDKKHVFNSYEDVQFEF